MAKREEMSGLPALPMEIVNRMEIGKDDLIAVAVSREEMKLLTEQSELDQQIKQLQKDHKATGKALEKSRQATVDAKCKKGLAAAKKGLEDAGFSCVTTDATVGCVTDGVISYTICVSSDGHRSLQRHATVKSTAEQRKLEKQSKATYEQIEHLQGQAVEVRKRISQLSSLERRAKATLATAVLSKTKEGRAYLSSLDGVTSLPMLTTGA